jgi:hypothetical protein
VPVVTGVGRVYEFTIDATHLCWTTDAGVWRRPKTLATPADALATCLPGAFFPPYLLRVQGSTPCGPRRS